MNVKLPAGWKVELLGLISAVRFTKGSLELLWCDGDWTMGRQGAYMSARGVPAASDMKQARSVGTAWLVELES